MVTTHRESGACSTLASLSVPRYITVRAHNTWDLNSQGGEWDRRCAALASIEAASNTALSTFLSFMPHRSPGVKFGGVPASAGGDGTPDSLRLR